MKLATRFRLQVLLSVAALAAAAVVTGRAFLETRAARADAELALRLQRTILERSMAREEFLLHGEYNALAEFRARSQAIREALQQGAAAFDEEDERRLLGRMAQQDAALVSTFDALLEGEQALRSEPAVPELRTRLLSRIVALRYDLATAAGGLAADAVARRDEAQQGALLAVLAIAGVALGIGVGGAVLLDRLVRRRLAALGEGAARLAEGDLAHRLAPHGDDELAQLGRAFDTMAARLQEAHAALAEANREQEAFSYSVSHDLRAPLRHVAGFVELLGRHAGPSLDQQGHHYLEVLERSARRMGQLIDDLLAFSRVGRSAMHPRRLAQRPLLDEVLRELQGEAAGREVAWEIGPLPDVVADPALLRLVWSNLLGNALKFTRDRRPAHIQVGASDGMDGQVRCWVRDDGVGFDMRYADKLFGVFQRLHRSEEFEGTGVGLANVQRIVTRHGGRVGAEGAVGRGATFWFTLPAAEEATCRSS